MGSRDKFEILWSEITGLCGFRISRKVTMIVIADKLRFGWHRHIVDHHAANSLQSDEGQFFAVDFPDHDCFWFRTFVVTPVLESRLVIGGVESFTERFRSDCLEVIARVEDEIPI